MREYRLDSHLLLFLVMGDCSNDHYASWLNQRVHRFNRKRNMHVCMLSQKKIFEAQINSHIQSRQRRTIVCWLRFIQSWSAWKIHLPVDFHRVSIYVKSTEEKTKLMISFEVHQLPWDIWIQLIFLSTNVK